MRSFRKAYRTSEEKQAKLNVKKKIKNNNSEKKNQILIAFIVGTLNGFHFRLSYTNRLILRIVTVR